MKRNNKTYGQIKEEVKEAEAIKSDFAKAANLEYRSKHSLTGEQKYNLLIILISAAAVLGFMLILTSGMR